MSHDLPQQLVDAAAVAGGGDVVLPAGVYRLADSLRLRSGVHIRADGEVILKQPPVVSSPLVDIVGYGHREFRVADPDRFRPGMGVVIHDAKTHGFGVTVARITERDGDTFFIDTPLRWDYHPGQGGRATALFPLIAGYDVSDASVEGLTLDGNSGEGEDARVDGCRSGGVFLLGCRGIGLRRLAVRHYRGDAISFQQCADVSIDRCHLHHNRGHGLHPGSGSVRYVMRGNHVHDNGGCGVFYCLRTTHSHCLDNRIHDNAQAGISVGERDTDHLIQGNDIRRSGHAGVAFRPPALQSGDRVIVRGNTFDDNGSPGPGGAGGPQIDVPAGLREVYVLGNIFAGEPDRAVAVADGAQGVVVADAWPDSRPLPAVGPAALAAGGGRHLGIENLSPWSVDEGP